MELVQLEVMKREGAVSDGWIGSLVHEVDADRSVSPTQQPPSY